MFIIIIIIIIITVIIVIVIIIIITFIPLSFLIQSKPRILELICP